MFTICPKCALTLVVTAADLRVAQGYVRCGRCLNVFNALARLSEERPGAAPAPPPEEAEPRASDGQPSAPSSTSEADDTGEIEIELDASILVTAARPPAAPQESAEPEAPANEPQPAAASGSPAAMPSAAAAEPAEARVAAPEEIPEESPAPAAQPHADAQPEPSAQAAPDADASADFSPAEQTNTARERSAEAFEIEAWRSHTGLGWKLGAGALALALALQVVNHYRDALAANPALSGPLHTVYSALGMTLTPRWNIHAYDVRQLGASVGGATPGEIVVRASVKNGASHAQPLPLLRVTLQDRFGNRIAARDVPPRDYLPSAVAPSSLLAAGSRVDATMVFVDPGPQAVGFEIDACLPVPGAHTDAPARPGQTDEVACAHGP